MALSRYSFVSNVRNGEAQGRSKASFRIFRAAQIGAIATTEYVIEEGERLDQIAGVKYGDGSLWWIIAAASGIGWCVQVPPGTLLTIPVNATEAMQVLI
tara:strand:- start:211 stop:507 length:297 start_codon:yes stop_codon:yes gene_type:complete